MWQTHPTKGPHSGVQPDKRADTLTKGDDNRTHAIAVDVLSLNGHLECLLFRIDRCFSLGRTLLMCWLCLHFKRLLSTHSYLCKPGMLLPWVDSRGALTGCGLKKIDYYIAVLEKYRWQNISGSSPQFCSQPGWPQGAQYTRDINLTPALPLHHFQSKVFKLEK